MNTMLQIDCFKNNVIFWKILGVWPEGSTSNPYFYKYYSIGFVVSVIILYDLLLTLNFFFLPSQLDLIIEELLFYCTELAVLSKYFVFLVWKDKINKILVMLESDIFQPEEENTVKIVEKAKRVNGKFWRTVAFVSVTSNLAHVLPPVVIHQFVSGKLSLPVCSYDFLPEKFKNDFKYPLYFYQAIGMHCHMWFNVNVDTFVWGVMILLTAQLDTLDIKFRKLTDIGKNIKPRESKTVEERYIKMFNKLMVHYAEISKFTSLIQEVFSILIFMQFGMASCIICVCLFRFTLPAPCQYYIFLATYTFMMVTQIFIPCSIGTKIIEKSCRLSDAVYSCDWIPRSRKFKSSLLLFVIRANRPLVIVGGKLFLLSLTTFTSIINSAYSFYSLLRYMKLKNA